MLVMLTPENKDLYLTSVREILWEYLQWANARINEEYGVNFEIAAMLATALQNLDRYMPPEGCLLLGAVDEQPAGIACLKRLAPGIGQFQRMYVRPAYRQRGLARALLNRLLGEAARLGYAQVYLDSAGFMKEAHKLYRTAGFHEIEPYEGTEIPEEYQRHWVFMALDLPGEQVQEDQAG